MANEIVTQEKRIGTVRNMLEEMRPELAKVLPKGYTPERMVRLAITALRRTPKLGLCTPLSLQAGVMDAAELGLDCSGVSGEGFLIPRKKHGREECNFQPGYKGLLKLAYQHPRVSRIWGEIVHENDQFAERLGSHPVIEHVRAQGDRGEVIGYYACASLQGDPNPVHKFMTKKEVEEHRDRYVQFLGPEGPWATHFDEMAMKTVFIKLAKLLPKSTQLERALSLDLRAEQGINTGASHNDYDQPIEIDPATGEVLADWPDANDDPDSDGGVDQYDLDTLAHKLAAQRTEPPDGDGDSVIADGIADSDLREAIETLVKSSKMGGRQWDELCNSVTLDHTYDQMDHDELVRLFNRVSVAVQEGLDA